MVFVEHFVSLQLPYPTLDQHVLEMRGLYNILMPPDISCLVGWPASMFSAWAQRQRGWGGGGGQLFTLYGLKDRE